MGKYIVGLMVIFIAFGASAFEGYNGATSLKLFNTVQCSTGLTCSKLKEKFVMVNSLGAAATFTDSDATPDVSGGLNFETNTTTVSITDFDGSDIYEGQVIYVVSKGAITYDVTTSGIVGGSTDIITAAGDVTVFMYDGADWLVTSRIDDSANLN